MMYWGGDMGGWGYVLTIVSFVLFWGTIITAIVLLARAPGAGGRRYDAGVPGRGLAEDLLAERFARGEIEENEYTARLATLRRGRGAAQ
jgi:putative membrane protein